MKTLTFKRPDNTELIVAVAHIVAMEKCEHYHELHLTNMREFPIQVQQEREVAGFECGDSNSLRVDVVDHWMEILK